MVMRAMREKMKPILWIAIIGFLGTIVFAWGMSYNKGGGCQKSPMVLVVNGEEVPYYEYYQLAEGLFRRYVANERSRMGDFYDPSVEPTLRDMAGQDAIELIIEDYVVRQKATEWGLGVTEEEVSQTIEQAPYFRTENGAFDRNLYEAFLRDQGTNDDEYRRTLGRQLLVEKVHSIIFDAVYVPEPMVRAEFLDSNQFASADFTKISYGDFVGDIVLAEAETRAYYDAHTDEFMAPAQACVDYVALVFDDLYARVELTDENLLAYYDQVKEEETSAGRIHVRHILFVTPPDADEKTVEAARARAAAVIERLNGAPSGGTDFEKIFDEYSQTPGPTDAQPEVVAEDLGFFGPGEMVPEFEEAAYALEPGATSPEPVRTAYGWHVIRRESDVPTFEEMRAELENRLRMDQALSAMDKFQGTLSQALSEGKSLEQAAALIPGVEVQRAGPFAQDAIIVDAKIGRFNQFRDAAFKLEPGQVSGILARTHEDPTDPDAAFKHDFYVLRVLERTSEKPYPFEDVRGRVEAKVLNQKAWDMAEKHAGELEALAKNVGLDRAAGELGDQVVSADQITRNGNIPGLGTAPVAARTAFELKSDELSGVVRDRDGFYIVRGKSVSEPSPLAYGNRLEGLRGDMISVLKNSFYRAWVDSLVAQAEVENHLDEILAEIAQRHAEAEQAAQEKEKGGGGGGGGGGYGY
ncbi:MAG TPA: SurA N-terminal domain-containing protein [bacterium]|nr:SurA N-terminal domain-containing protein [bacterium]